MDPAAWGVLSPEAISDMIAQSRFSDRKCRLFAVAVCRAWGDRIDAPDCQALLDLGEGFADGFVSKRQLERARRAVYRRVWPVWHAPPWAKDWVPYWAAWNAAVPRIVPPCRGLFRLDRTFVPVAADVFGNRIGHPTFPAGWRTSTAIGVAASMYESRDFAPMPILADALEDAGCDSPDILAHCRGPGPHVRGCWVVDPVLGKS